MRRTVVVAALLAAGLLVAPGASSASAACRPSLSGVALTDAAVRAGDTVRATVRLRCRATAKVKVRVRGFAGVAVPRTVRVAKGARTARFTVRTRVAYTPRRGKIVASLKGKRRSATLSVAAACRPVPTSISLDALSAGESTRAAIRVSCAPRTKVALALRSQSPNLVVPATVTLPAGSVTVWAPVSAKLVEGPQYRTSLSVTTGGRTVSRTAVVTPGLKQFELSPSSDVNDVSPAVILTGPAPAGGLTLRLRSSSPSVRVPATWHLPAGSYGAGGLAGIEVAPVTVDTKVVVTASLGTRSLSDSRVLRPPFDGSQPVTVRSWEDGPVYGGLSRVELGVGIPNPAPTGGAPVTVSVRDDDPAVTVESTPFDISAGTTSTSFQVRTAVVTRTTRVLLDVTVGSARTSYELVIHPGLAKLVLPESVVSATPFTGTVSLAGASEIDSRIRFETGWGILDAGPAVVIPAGETSATFSLTSSRLATAARVDVQAMLGRSNLTTYVTLMPAP